MAEESKGLGDTIAKVTEAVGIKPCGSCKKRQEALNKMFSYSQEDRPGRRTFFARPVINKKKE